MEIVTGMIHAPTLDAPPQVCLLRTSDNHAWDVIHQAWTETPPQPMIPMRRVPALPGVWNFRVLVDELADSDVVQAAIYSADGVLLEGLQGRLARPPLVVLGNLRRFAL